MDAAQPSWSTQVERYSSLCKATTELKEAPNTSNSCEPCRVRRDPSRRDGSNLRHYLRMTKIRHGPAENSSSNNTLGRNSPHPNPLPAGEGTKIVFRWCRFAQPPANRCEPAGFGAVGGFFARWRRVLTHPPMSLDLCVSGGYYLTPLVSGVASSAVGSRRRIGQEWNPQGPNC
jgi:hypothetical protein